METSAIQKIKKTADKLFARNLDTGRVLEVRFWEPDTLIEIDLHLPLINMNEWTEVPYIKFKVDEHIYRDYTPACWDAETHTCTVFVDAGHAGPGCNWARQLRNGDAVYYLKTGTSQQQPDALKTVVALGDESSMGQLLALQQMTMPQTRFSGAIVMNKEEHNKLFGEYFRSPLQALLRKDNYGHHTLMEWVLAQQYKLADSVFYISGNNIMVTQLRKMLKQQGYGSAQIKVKGFWS
jgi:NADPH-dependent ferric siderophore reductase